MGPEVVVIGSINYDISVFAPRLPQPGETLLGSDHLFGPGGKGANQAVAAARLGARVGMVGQVGSDEWGEALVAGLVEEGIDVTAVGRGEGEPTGIAVITIDQEAENTIVASPGANQSMDAGHIESHAQLISGARVVLAQLEIPMDSVLAAAKLTTGVFVLNPAPARAISEEVLDRVDVLVPNRSELALLTGENATTPEQVADATSRLRDTLTTVVTLGADGALLVEGGAKKRIDPFEVEAVDPTGAGDTFCGGLAAALSRGQSIEEGVRLASAAAALSVTRAGAQSGMPTLADVEALLAV